MIQAYFDQIKALADQYAATRNARHRPPLRSLEHKHTPGQVIGASAPTLEDVLAEIVMAKGWV